MLDKYGSVACLNEKIGKEEISVESKKKKNQKCQTPKQSDCLASLKVDILKSPSHRKNRRRKDKFPLDLNIKKCQTPKHGNSSYQACHSKANPEKSHSVA